MFSRALVALLVAAPYVVACSDPSSSPASEKPQPGAAGEGGDGDIPQEIPAQGGAGANQGGRPNVDEPEAGGSPDQPEPNAGAFFLPTDEPTNTRGPRVETDARGGSHFVYPAFAIGDAFYGYCPATCRGAEDMQVVRLETQGSVTNAALALDEQSRPRVLLATLTSVYFASCDDACTEPESWTTTKIIEHDGEREVTGEALALQDGKPRFLMHAYRKFLGAFQKPETLYVSCDSGCDDARNWTTSSISGQLWEGSTLRFDAAGTAHVATTVQVVGDAGIEKIAGYFECAGDCDVGESWKGLGLDHIYENRTADPTVEPSVSLALTRRGAPRIIVLGQDDDGRRISYHACDDNCLDYAGWAPFMRITDAGGFGAGLDLALNEADQPRFVFTSGFNIVLAQCSDEPCTDDDAEWKFTSVEKASSMKPDEIILWPNCTVSGWLLHAPSLALSPSGAPRVGYQARDISAGTGRPDPTKPVCTAGTDMSFTRATFE